MKQFMCQFKCIPDLTYKVSPRVMFIERLRAIALRLKRTVNFLKNNIKLMKALSNIEVAWKKSERKVICVGDKVRVISQDDIRNMVDYRGIYKGCPFLSEQYAFCGNTYYVLEEINYFYDEIKNKLCKCRDMVILEGTFCRGKQKFYAESCDLDCYFFWHKDWLEKVE